MTTAVATLFALTAFAANSILCRLALDEASIDPVSFSTVRLLSGAFTLLGLAALSSPKGYLKTHRNWISACMLAAYAFTFALAYVSLSTGTGALILFGSVQMTMIVTALYSGERPSFVEWAGLLLALAGLVYLMFPGLEAPSPLGSVLMAISGISWGIYSLRGRNSAAPLPETSANFFLAVFLAMGISLIFLPTLYLSRTGLLLAALSGSIASGLGYVVWYMALRGLTATRAAIVQLSVPVLAAIGGVILLSEELSMRLLLAMVMILGGIGLATAARDYLQGAREQ